MFTEAIKCQNCFAELDIISGGGIVQCEYCGHQNVLSQEIRTVQADYSHAFVLRLYKAMADLFCEDAEVRDLIIEFSGAIPTYRLTYGNIPGSSSQSKIRELIQWAQRWVVLQELVDVVISLRPRIQI